MNDEPQESGTYKLSDRLSVTIRFSRRGVTCVWDPEIPDALTAAELDEYRKRRDGLMVRLSRRIGGSIGCVET